MLFNSYTFIIFFAAVLALSRVIAPWRARKALLLGMSYVFYAAWNPPFVLLLWFSTVVDWHAGKRLHASRSVSRRRFYLSVSLLANLGLLSYFKYGGFLVDNLNALLSALNIDHTFGQPSIILPVGISFYTFQTLSYTIDIFRRKFRPWHSFLDYALYVTFFPQLVAGPIVRAADFLPQCNAPRQGSRDQIGWGLSLLVVGLFSKVVIADALMAQFVEAVYDSSLHAGFLLAWAGTVAFAVQIFCDFAGYSACAIGVALCLGFRLPDNFRQPYAAVGFSDFWKRWHISLSSWLRDYLYIPLGGNRKGVPRTYLNLALTMLLGGLWHGASWMFVIWGGLHGCYLMAERLLVRSKQASAAFWRTATGQLMLSLATFALVCFTWVFFRAHTLGRALSIAGDMLAVPWAGASLPPVVNAASAAPGEGAIRFASSSYLLILVCAGGLIGFHHLLKKSSLEQLFARLPWYVHSLLLAGMIYLIAISMTGEDRAFIYFQF
ncbi:MAG: MBOAT family O-acyltransferase [Acidobacteriota bacterium]